MPPRTASTNHNRTAIANTGVAILTVIAAIIFGVGAWLGQKYGNNVAQKQYLLSLSVACDEHPTLSLCHDLPAFASKPPKSKPASLEPAPSSCAQVMRHRINVCEYKAEHGETSILDSLYGKRSLENFMHMPLKRASMPSDAQMSSREYWDSMGGRDKYMYAAYMNCLMLPYEARIYEYDPKPDVDSFFGPIDPA